MWIRKSDRDRQSGNATPVPTQVVGNEEFEPMPQTPDQRRVEQRIFELADHYGQKLGMSRRAFLRTSGGMAVSFMAMNEVFGRAFLVSEAEAAELSTVDLGDLEALRGVVKFPVRIKCATLAWNTLADGLNQAESA